MEYMRTTRTFNEDKKPHIILSTVTQQVSISEKEIKTKRKRKKEVDLPVSGE